MYYLLAKFGFDAAEKEPLEIRNLDGNLEIWTGENSYSNSQISVGIGNLNCAARKASDTRYRSSTTQTKQGVETRSVSEVSHLSPSYRLRSKNSDPLRSDRRVPKRVDGPVETLNTPLWIFHVRLLKNKYEKTRVQSVWKKLRQGRLKTKTLSNNKQGSEQN